MPAFWADEARLQTLEEQARTLLADAHAHLDQGKYKEAETKHRRSAQIGAEADALKADLQKRLQAIVDELVGRLNAEKFAVRKAASVHLASLGPRTKPHLIRALETQADPETQFRLKELLGQLGDVELDDQGRVCQWALEAKASTEYGNPTWAASQATGKPDTPNAGDHATAWAPRGTDIGAQWLQLEFPHAVFPAAVRVVETYNPGTVVKLEAVDAKGAHQVLWEGKDEARKAPATFEIAVPRIKAFKTKVIRLTLNTDLVTGYNEIDAVQLIGRP